MLRHTIVFAAVILVITLTIAACRTDKPIEETDSVVVQPVIAVYVVATPTPAPAIPTVGPLFVKSSARTNPSAINGVPISRVAVIPDAVRAHIREVYARGQTLGRDARAFSKIGDSTMVYPPFLAAFDSTGFSLGQFAALQPTIDLYAGSFARTSAAARKGMHTWTEFDPDWVSSDDCRSGEGPLDCELRLHNPSIAIIRLGANDFYTVNTFREHLVRIVDVCLERGVVPILGTKPDRLEGDSNALNRIIGQVATEKRIPLWDYDVIAATVPNKGLEKDGVHIRGGGSHNYAAAKAFASGDSLEDLTALILLDAVRRELAPTY